LLLHNKFAYGQFTLTTSMQLNYSFQLCVGIVAVNWALAWFYFEGLCSDILTVATPLLCSKNGILLRLLS